jgi:hypothetical protein
MMSARRKEESTATDLLALGIDHTDEAGSVL